MKQDGVSMKTLTLKNKFQTNATLLPNDFIDNYMVNANGEFIKVYLFLLRHAEDDNPALTLSMIADCLNNTEKDILRALTPTPFSPFPRRTGKRCTISITAPP